MSNVYGTPEKVSMKTALFNAAVSALEQSGWKVERIDGSGKSSVRRITRGAISKIVSIRTTQDRSIAFPRTNGDKSWRTLDDVDAVIASSVDHREKPRFANVHMLPGDEMRDRFNRTYVARRKAGHTIPTGRGVWLSLYSNESASPVHLVGAGAGLKHPPFAQMALDSSMVAGTQDDGREDDLEAAAAPLTIPEAKVRLARSLGIDPSCIKIIVES
jgi:hypothetical protein